MWPSGTTAFPPRTIAHVRRSLPHLRFRGRKWAPISSSPASVSAAEISAPRLSHPNSPRSVVRSPRHYKGGAFGLVPHGRDYPLYRLSVVWGNVTSNDVPSPPATHHLDAEHVSEIVLTDHHS